MTTDQQFDVIVIGSGPGGEGAAMQAAKGKKKTALIERFPQVGGSCTHLGTIPSKTLRHMAYRIANMQTDPLFSSYINYPKFRIKDLLERANLVINKQIVRRRSHYVRNNVSVFHGNAYIEDKNTVTVQASQEKSPITLKAESLILATGSKPYHPPHVDFNHPRIFDSDTILKIQETPSHLIIYGAGVVGCEYASIFSALGTKVTLINTHNKLLRFLDHDITDALSYHLRDMGVKILNNDACETIDPQDQSVVTKLKSGRSLQADVVLVTTGRTGNVVELGLENVGIEHDHRGRITVNSHYQTSQPNIYSVGDLVGFPSLASSAYDQGRFAALHMIDPTCDDSLVKDIPIGIYTSPEISSIGRTEQQLIDEGINYEIGHVAFKHLARAQITGNTTGMLKILFDTRNLAILGIHCFGQNAAEIIHIGQAIMAQEVPHNSLKYFIKTTFNYPTMAEAYRVAALNGLNRLKYHS